MTFFVCIDHILNLKLEIFNFVFYYITWFFYKLKIKIVLESVKLVISLLY